MRRHAASPRRARTCVGTTEQALLAFDTQPPRDTTIDCRREARSVRVHNGTSRQLECRGDGFGSPREVSPHEDERGRALATPQRLEGEPAGHPVEQPPLRRLPLACLAVVGGGLRRGQPDDAFAAVEIIRRRALEHRLEPAAAGRPPGGHRAGEDVVALRVGVHVRRRVGVGGGEVRRGAPQVRIDPKDERGVGGAALADGAHLGDLRHELVQVVEHHLDPVLAGELDLVE
mmetsp:Transcript_31938/g.66898  ORF Transcript_31938/g.66898 Transcript_31938/m.66898 type:complete len:231 (-) Transcript_31938:465-1157(-)